MSDASILPTDSPDFFAEALRRASEFLRSGHAVAVPTETVYGLAANAFDANAVAKIFEIKGRPPNNPLIVHVATFAMARDCVLKWPASAQKLADAFWPGPLTLVMAKSLQVPDIVTAGGSTVGIRWPAHPFMRALIQQCGFPLAAPSANPSNAVSPTTAAHVKKQLGSRVPLIVDGGRCQVGIESTVLDLTIAPPRVLRPGMIDERALESVIGGLSNAADAGEGPLKSPGLLPKHYAPRATLQILRWNDDRDLRNQIIQGGFQLAGVFVLAHTRVPSVEGLGGVSVIPHDPEAFARGIYAELHACDERDAKLIIVEDLPDTVEWNGIRDRLKRAAHT